MKIKYSLCLFLLSPNQQVRIFLEQTVSGSPTQLLLMLMEEKKNLPWTSMGAACFELTLN